MISYANITSEVSKSNSSYIIFIDITVTYVHYK